ncbi:LysR substrate-binding domain-containing protein [Dongia sp.]|uniref:LysR substrate-binding domain-containing protein n=1 Tax=Dongia sp. TaxID=1977262 RepID=UPI0035B060E9
MRRLPPLAMLRSFEAAARHVGFARAGAELGVTAAAISQQVRALEEYLGQALFLRRAQGLALTDRGLSYLTIVRDAFDRLGAGTDELFHGRDTAQVALRVTAGFAHLWFASRLSAFLTRHPEMPVRVLTSLWTPIELDPDVDFEIRCGIGSWPGLTAYPLTRDRLFPVCAPELIEGEARPRDPAALLAGQRLIHIEGFAEGWPEWGKGAGVALAAPSLAFDTASLAIDLALAGGGVLIGRTSLVESPLADGRLIAPFATKIKCTENFYLVERAGERLSQPARILRDWLLAEAAQ